jgi:mono/diheme cytochrome c family protein
MNNYKFGMQNADCGMKTPQRTALGFAAILIVGFTGCQQKMAEQPSPRPYAVSEFFPHKQSARPLEVGVVHVGQMPDSDPLVTGLSQEYRKKWASRTAVDALSAPYGAPNDVANFASEFPFEMTEEDLHRGQQRYNIFCAICHGAAGDAMGKIAERGYLRPPSYHADPAGKALDWSTPGANNKTSIPRGHSRGFYRYYDATAEEKLASIDKLEAQVKSEKDAVRKGELEQKLKDLKADEAKFKAEVKKQKDAHVVALADVPVGYIFEVITKGYGGMPEHASQIPPADRWRIIAYIRALQLSQGAPKSDLPEAAGKKLAEPKH